MQKKECNKAKTQQKQLFLFSQGKNQYEGQIFQSSKAKYLIQEEIGIGYFSKIYKCLNLQDKKQYALKLQLKPTKGHNLVREIQIINSINERLPDIQYELKNIVKIVKIYDYFILSQEKMPQNGDFFISDLCQNSLQTIMSQKSQNKKGFSLKTTLSIGYLLICVIEGLHKTGYLHRDIKPENILIRNIPQNQQNQKTSNICLVLVDFGLSMKYLDQKNSNKHFQFADKKKLTGSWKFSSLNSHWGYKFSRRDEIQNILYTLIYLKNSELPWSNVKQQAKMPSQQIQKMAQKQKEEISIQEICKQFPKEFIELFYYVRKLAFQQDPNYIYIKELIKKCLLKSINEQQTQKFTTNKKQQEFELQSFIKQQISDLNGLGQ